MKIQNFIKSLSTDSINDNTDMIKKSHPLQWIEDNIDIPIWKVEYSYTTNNKNKSNRIKYIIKPELDSDEIKHYFLNHIEDYNNKHPYRAISNVEILDIEYIDGVKLYLE